MARLTQVHDRRQLSFADASSPPVVVSTLCIDITEQDNPFHITLGFSWVCKTKVYHSNTNKKEVWQTGCPCSKMTIAEECLKHKHVKTCVIAKVGKLVREEVRSLCSDRHGSVLKNTNPQTLHNFKGHQ